MITLILKKTKQKETIILKKKKKKKKSLGIIKIKYIFRIFVTCGEILVVIFVLFYIFY